MSIDAALLRILVLVLPGLTGRMVFVRLKANRATAVWQATLEVFLFAIASYALAGVILTLIFGFRSGVLSENIAAILADSSDVNWLELSFAALMSVPTAFSAALLHNRKVIHRIARCLRITQSYGDEDVWEYIHNSPDVEWIYLRDHEQRVIYFGKVLNYSDSGKEREIVLSDVTTFDATTGELLYEIDGVYISRDKNRMTIDIPLFASHVPDQFDEVQWTRLMEQASNEQKDLLRHLYHQPKPEAAVWSLRDNQRPADRRKLQGLLDECELSVVQLRREKDGN